MREATLLAALHPETYRGTDGVERRRVDLPVLFPLEHGAPDLGWEGDTRLVMYANPVLDQWELWRLEHDGVYRHTGIHSPTGAMGMSPEDVNRLIRLLIEKDTRRGFDPAQRVLQVAREVDVAKEKERADWIYGEAAPKLQWALKRSHLPGVV